MPNEVDARTVQAPGAGGGGAAPAGPAAVAACGHRMASAKNASATEDPALSIIDAIARAWYRSPPTKLWSCSGFLRSQRALE